MNICSSHGDSALKIIWISTNWTLLETFCARTSEAYRVLCKVEMPAETPKWAVLQTNPWFWVLFEFLKLKKLQPFSLKLGDSFPVFTYMHRLYIFSVGPNYAHTDGMRGGSGKRDTILRHTKFHRAKSVKSNIFRWNILIRREYGRG